MCTVKGEVTSRITLVHPETWNSRFFNDTYPWLSSNTPDHITAENHSPPINACTILWQVYLNKTFNTNMPENANSKSRCPPFLISKITPHTHIISHDAHLHYRAISHFTAKWVLQRKYPGCSLFIHTGISFTIYSRIPSVMPPHIKKSRETVT